MRRLALLFVVALSIFSPLPLGAGQGPRASFAQEIAISADAAQPPDPNDVLAQYLEAVRLREAGAVDAAVEAMERVHALAPDDPDLTLELARTYEAARLYGHAAAAYAEAAMIAPTRADLALAQAHFHLDHAFRVRDALLAAEHAARLRPDDPEVIQLLDRARTAALLADS